ncbi:MAG: amylo-alpha-1,6-glucosidase [Solirubrobacterales bacterium]
MDSDLTIAVGGAADLAGKEWMVANGLGGYASGTLAGGVSRRHDGLLVSALDAPHGRTVMLDRIDERLDGVSIFDRLQEIRLERGLPVWRFALGETVIERRVVMPWRQNTVHLLYRVVKGEAAALEIRPWFHIRHADWQVDQPLGPAAVTVEGDRIEVVHGAWPAVRLIAPGAAVAFDDERTAEAVYPVETERGYLDHGPLWSPGTLTVPLQAGGGALSASTENWAVATALSPEEAWDAEQERRRRLIGRAHPALRSGPAALLAMAADAFVFTPRNRPELTARVNATGDQLCSIIAGYPWFNDWGRDTMISLEGLTLVTGRASEARDILRTFARYVKDGLIPDNIPDGPWPPVYHSADATLWFFHAVDRYLVATGDAETRDLLLPSLVSIIEAHRRGTLFNIGVDPEDGLLRQGAEGYQLTWMDAIVDDWVVTPRRGKPVEINALWHNALCVLARLLSETGDAEGARRAAADAARARASFNRRFWAADLGHLYDVIDGDPAEAPLCRPNQIFAVSLPHPVLEERYWPAVVDTVEARLLTPFGLRSLAPGTPGYRPRFGGDQRSRDGAYHQGTVWPWLLGAFIDARMKVRPHQGAEAMRILDGMQPHLGDYCIGTIGEVFDADPPHGPRGCTAQAWSVAEWLRARVRAASADGVRWDG